MANEISVSLTFTVSNPSTGTGFSASVRKNAQFNQNALGQNAEIVSVPTAATSYAFTNLSTYGWLYIQNLDATNYVDYGPMNAGTLYPFGRLKPGEFALLRLTPGITFGMQANTAAVDVSYQLYND